MTLWSPDTCGHYPPCEIELDDDRNSPTYGEPVRHLRACVGHANKAMDHAAVAAECRTKEKARDAIAKAVGIADPDTVDWSIDKTTRAIMVGAGLGLTGAARSRVLSAVLAAGLSDKISVG